MFKKMIASFLILATSTVFGMSLSTLNSANKTELMQINGIGEAKAAAIIKERRKGKFKSFEDFQRVEGIGAQTAANVKNNVKSAADVKKVKKSTKKKTAKKTKSTKKDVEKKAKKSKTKKRKIKSMDEKKKELKKKAKKTKTKKTKAKKTKKTKSKKKN
jgi:competence protein ComEA